MRKSLSLLFAIIFSTHAFAKTVILKSPQADAKDYQAFVLSSPAYEFPTQAILSKMPTPEARDHLAALFAKAQASFMEGSPTQANEDFKAVVALAETDHWGEEEQTVLLHSYLRLAHLSHNPTEAEEFLRQAIIWTPKATMDEKFFPPPLVEKYKKQKSGFPTSKIDFGRFSPDFDFVVINGRVMDLAEKTSNSVFNGPIRVTFLSDAFQTVTLETTADQLANLVVEKKPWLEGSCLKPKMHWQQAGSIVKPFFSKTCAPLKSKPEATVDLAFHSPSVAEPNPLPISTTSTSQTRIPFYKKTWFWLGVGAVATAIIVASASKHETQPTSHDGF